MTPDFSLYTSPPARVAWIETVKNFANINRIRVATREGGVDRNVFISVLH